MTAASYNIIVVNMIPALITMPGCPWAILPPGLHQASLEDVATTFAVNPWRQDLYQGLVEASGLLRHAGCPTLFIDGSYVTGKPRPGDFDACWDPTGVIRAKLDPVFLDFKNSRAAQKARFKGEFFPSSFICNEVGKSFLEFFQIERFTGNNKGLLSISLLSDSVLLGSAKP